MRVDVIMMLQQAPAQAPARPTPPTPPAIPIEVQPVLPGGAPSGRELGEQIRQSVQQAVQQARDAQRAAALDQQRAARDAERAIRDAQRSTRNTFPEIVFQPGGRGPIIPSGAVDIAVAFFVMCAVMLIGFPIARAIARRIDRKSATMTTPPDVNARLERIEQAVDTIAIEMERVSESQRYATRVLSEIRALPAPALNPLDAARGVNREAVGAALRTERAPDHR